MSIQEAQIVSMKQFQRLMTTVSPNVTVCVRGRHAVGKSEGVYQAAAKVFSDTYKDPASCADVIAREGGRIRHATGWKSEWSYELGLPVVERRLSQMTEGDLLGLPDKENQGDEKSESTKFLPCDWVITACKYPVMLFLDERNRALPQVKQCIFQLADSKVFYNNHFHDETRLCIAENMGDEYQVEQLDPAEISRCVTVSLDPSVLEWLEWAKVALDESTVEFIRQNETALEFRGAVPEPNKKYPDRRAWANLDREMRKCGMFETPDDPMIRIMAGAFIGTDHANKYAQFIKDRRKQVSAEDIIKDWGATRKRLMVGDRIPNEVLIEAIAKLEIYVQKVPKDKSDKGFEKLWPETASVEVAAFMGDLPAEMFMTAFKAIGQNQVVLSNTHKLIKLLLVATVQGQSSNGDAHKELAEKISAKKEELLQKASKVNSTEKQDAKAKDGVRGARQSK
jgi:hypothetical protein